MKKTRGTQAPRWLRQRAQPTLTKGKRTIRKPENPNKRRKKT